MQDRLVNVFGFLLRHARWLFDLLTEGLKAQGPLLQSKCCGFFRTRSRRTVQQLSPGMSSGSCSSIPETVSGDWGRKYSRKGLTKDQHGKAHAHRLLVHSGACSCGMVAELWPVS
jgi:hypothetical protein